MTWGQQLCFLPEKSRAMDFYHLKNPSFSAWLEPVNLGSNGKNNNHYTTEKDWLPC
jgi:hypothetical protein